MVKVTFKPRAEGDRKFKTIPEGERKINIIDASIGKTKNGRDCVNLYLCTKGEDQDIFTKHTMLMDSYEFENMCRALLQNFVEPEDANTFNFDPGFLVGQWFSCTVKHTVSAQGMTFNDLKNIKKVNTMDSTDKEELPF